MSLNIQQKELSTSIIRGADWLIKRAQVHDESDLCIKTTKYPFTYFKGMLRNEYIQSEGLWNLFGTLWHTGQGIVAMLDAYALSGEKRFLDAAVLAGEWILEQQLDHDDHDDHDAGLIKGFEDDGDAIGVSCILESLVGLFALERVTKNKKWLSAAISAVDWIARKSYIQGTGLFREPYHFHTRKFGMHHFSLKHQESARPLNDDAIFLLAYRATGEKKYLKIFQEATQLLVNEENPHMSGNWIDYMPNNLQAGTFHARMAFWWGMCLVHAYEEFGDSKILEVAVRSGEWYTKAQRLDGGLFYQTDLNFDTPTTWQCVSGMACAILLWRAIQIHTGDCRFDENIEKGLSYIMSSQITSAPKDSFLYGCFPEGFMPFDGNEYPTYWIRDIATIFSIQAMSKLVADSKESQLRNGIPCCIS